MILINVVSVILSFRPSPSFSGVIPRIIALTTPLSVVPSPTTAGTVSSSVSANIPPAVISAARLCITLNLPR